MEFRRVTVDPDRMGGVPCVRDLRFPVASVVAMVADGMSVDEILAEHPDLEPGDISECLRYAALAVQERELLADLSALLPRRGRRQDNVGEIHPRLTLRDGGHEAVWYTCSLDQTSTWADCDGWLNPLPAPRNGRPYGPLSGQDRC